MKALPQIKRISQGAEDACAAGRHRHIWGLSPEGLSLLRAGACAVFQKIRGQGDSPFQPPSVPAGWQQA